MSGEKQPPNPDETRREDAAPSPEETEDASLDPGLMDVLRQADTGVGDSILDDAPLAGADPLSDEPVVPGAAQADEGVLATAGEDMAEAAPPDSLTQKQVADLFAAHDAKSTAKPPVEEEEQASQPAAAFEEEEPLSQEMLDGLTGHDSATETTIEVPAGVPVSQGDLDALVQDFDNSTPAAAPPKEAVTPSEAPSPPTSSAAPGDELDALVKQLDERDKQGPAEAAADSSGPLDQSDLDALISGIQNGGGDSDEVVELSNDEIDAVDAATSTAGPADTGDNVGVTQDDIDALMGGASSTGAPAAEEEASSAADGPISQSLIDDLVSGAKSEETAEDVGSENLAAAASSGEGTQNLLSQDDLDAIMDQARAQQKDRTSKASAAIAEAVERAKTEAVERVYEPSDEDDAEAETMVEAPEDTSARNVPIPVFHLLLRNAPRIAASLLAGVLTGAVVLTTLLVFKEEVPPMDALGAGQVGQMRHAMDQANALMDVGDYSSARATLEAALETAEPGPLRDDATFALLEARSLAFRPADRDTPKFLRLRGDIATAVDRAPGHPRVPEALYWKAKLYEMDDRGLYAARDVYKRLLDDFPAMERRDVIMLDAAELALELPTPEPVEAYQLAQRLLSDFPGSPLAGVARLVMADAYAAVGQTDDARTLYLRTAEANASNDLGAEAYLRIAQLSYDERKYKTAIQHLETRLKGASTTRGNDELFLLLGRAQHRLGDLDAARGTLTDLLNFFPESEVTPRALVELSQVLFQDGDREEALHRAQEAVVRFSYDPGVLRNHGQLLGITGDALRAAEALVDADAAGANDPALLLTAARHYRAAGRGKEAVSTYDDLRRAYPVAPESTTGGIEAANLLFDLKQANEALERLDEIERATKGSAKHVDALAAMLRIYESLGFRERVVPLAYSIAAEATEPTVLADAARALAGVARAAPDQSAVLDKALAIYARVDKERLSDAAAHALTHTLGGALVQADPVRGLQLLEGAYLEYPGARTRQAEQELLDAYLRANRVNDARRMVMELGAHVREHPADTPYLIDAATAWGEHLYRAEDYRLAADAFKIAVDASFAGGRRMRGKRSDPAWAQFQRANALLNLKDYAASRVLFEEIAGANSAWSQEAGAKAKYAQTEEQRHGFTPAGPNRS